MLLDIINSYAQQFLIFIDTGLPRTPGLITIIAGVALLFVSFEMFSQYKQAPDKYNLYILFLLFLFDGMDYITFALLDVLGPLASLFGIIFDICVAITAILLIFQYKGKEVK